MSAASICRACPSLALVKYWGKSEGAENIPATPSLAVTLGGVHTETRALLAKEDSVTVNSARQDPARFAPFFDNFREKLGVAARFRADSANTFPSSAGLASSSSGFAALAGACAAACAAACATACAASCAAPARREPSLAELSALARVGSASAARAVFGGFVLLPAGAREAHPLHGPEYWPELRIVVVLTERGPKPVSSRAAMEATRATSPYYPAWLAESAAMLPDALRGLETRDIELLGEAARRSYSLMHAALLGARPPILYWLPATVAAIRACDALRRRGVGAWETIDAGPQVKILCLEADVRNVVAEMQGLASGVDTIVCLPGPGLSYGPDPGPQ